MDRHYHEGVRIMTSLKSGLISFIITVIVVVFVNMSFHGYNQYDIAIFDFLIAIGLGVAIGLLLPKRCVCGHRKSEHFDGFLMCFHVDESGNICACMEYDAQTICKRQ